MSRIYLFLLFTMMLAVPAHSAILVFSTNGTYTIKTSLSQAATEAECAGKTIMVTSALSSSFSNISSATLHEWPADRKLGVAQGGSINPTTKFVFAPGREEPVTPEMFGYVSGGNVTSNTAAFQRAVDAYSHVKLSDGNYTIKQVQLNYDSKISGAAGFRKSTITVSNADGNLKGLLGTTGESGIVIENINFVWGGTPHAAGSTGLYLPVTAQAKIDQCQFQYFYYGAYLDDALVNKFSHCRFYANTFGIYIYGITGANFNVVEFTRFLSNDIAGIAINTDGNGQAINNFLNHIDAEGNGWGVLQSSGGPNTVKDSYFETSVNGNIKNVSTSGPLIADGCLSDTSLVDYNSTGVAQLIGYNKYNGASGTPDMSSNLSSTFTNYGGPTEVSPLTSYQSFTVKQETFDLVKKANTTISQRHTILSPNFGIISPYIGNIINLVAADPSIAASWDSTTGITVGVADPVGGTGAVSYTGDHFLYRSDGNKSSVITCQAWVKVPPGRGLVEFRYIEGATVVAIKRYPYNSSGEGWVLLWLNALVGTSGSHAFHIITDAEISVYSPQMMFNTDSPTPYLPANTTISTPTMIFGGQAVSFGANDSGGAGFKLLRLPN